MSENFYFIGVGIPWGKTRFSPTSSTHRPIRAEITRWNVAKNYLWFSDVKMVAVR